MDYVPGLAGFLFIAVFNLISAGALYGLGKASKQKPLAFWIALAASTGFLLWAHGTVNLRSHRRHWGQTRLNRDNRVSYAGTR
jgi:hypothetical protein